MREYTMKAMKSTSEWNRQFLKERNEERRAYFDMQTFVRSRVFNECLQFYQLSAKLCYEKRHLTCAGCTCSEQPAQFAKQLILNVG